jgi:hypothetical protein
MKLGSRSVRSVGIPLSQPTAKSTARVEDAVGHFSNRARRRRRFNRVLRVQLECECVAELQTGRCRVSKDLAAILYSGAVRRGVWCFKHAGKCQPTACVGVFREV